MTTQAILTADINLWLARSDLSSRAASFIRIAEAAINRTVRVKAMETSTDLTITDTETPLPADFVELIALANRGEMPFQYRTSLELRSRREIDDLDRTQVFTIENNSLVFPRAHDPAIELELVYLARFAPVVEPEDTNWLLTNNYDIYLYLTLSAASDAKQDAARSSKFMDMARAAIKELHRADSRRSLADFAENRSVSAPTDFP